MDGRRNTSSKLHVNWVAATGCGEFGATIDWTAGLRSLRLAAQSPATRARLALFKQVRQRNAIKLPVRRNSARG